MSVKTTLSRTLFLVRPPMVYEQIKKQSIESVPFAKHTGVVITEAARGRSEARLTQRTDVSNHVGTLHAAALFALGEAASGVAMAGALAPVILAVRPVAAQASIRYLKPATGTVTARGEVRRDADELVRELQQQGKTRFEVDVTLSDEQKVIVCEMTVEWHARLKT